MRANKLAIAIPFVSALALGGCGTFVPDHQDNPFASERERSDFIQAIVLNVRCEVQDAVIRLYAENDPYIDPFNRNLGWFNSWGAQISLTLTIDEKTVLNPTGNWLPVSPPSSVFNLALGATLSAEAQRIDKIGAFFTVDELRHLKACPLNARNRGPFILQSDLKLYDWLKAMTISTDLGNTPAPVNEKGPFKSNVLSHEVKFDIITTGTATPGWKLSTGTINQTGTFFSATRDRTQDLVVTFGPPDPAWLVVAINPATGKPLRDRETGRPIMRAGGLGPAAQSAATAADFGNAVTNGVRNALRQ
jgi:hypothetical protein